MKGGLAGDDPQATKQLMHKLEEDMVETGINAFSTLVSTITYIAIMRQKIGTGSPSEGWAIPKKLYATRTAAEKVKLTQAWYDFTMKDREPTSEFFARGSVLRS